MRLNGTFDIDYDDGEKETGVTKDLIRVLEKSSKSRSRVVDDGVMRFEEGMKVEAQYKGRSKFYPGKIVRVRDDGTFDIDYDDGEKEKRVKEEFIRALEKPVRASSPSRSRLDDFAASKSREKMRDMRLESFGKVSRTDPSGFSSGSRVACFWYRQSKFGKPKAFCMPKSAIVLSLNSDGTYSVELEGDCSRYDDVPSNYLKAWSDVQQNIELKPAGARSFKYNEWSAVDRMVKAFIRKGRITHDIPSLVSNAVGNEMKRLELVLGEAVLKEFREVFDKYEEEDQVDVDSALKAFKNLGGDASESELKTYFRRCGFKKAPKYIDFAKFLLTYANLFYDSSEPLQNNSSAVGRSLRLDDEWADLGRFARSYGKKQLLELERAFDSFARKDENGSFALSASDLLEAFHRVGRAVTVTRLREWMEDADVRPNDTLTLVDFVSVFHFFFEAARAEKSGRGPVEPKLLSISDLAVAVLQEAEWNGTSAQHNSLLSRLCAGRSVRTIALLTQIRDAFELLDTTGKGFLSLESIPSLFRKAAISLAAADYSFNLCIKKVQKKGADVISLAEIFEHFGSLITELADSAANVGEAFAMLRTKLASVDIRAAADLAIRILDRAVAHQDPKYWQINVKSEVSPGSSSVATLITFTKIYLSAGVFN